MLMGGLGVGASAAMFAGALLGTYALLATERPRRVGLVLTTAAGWIGFAVLAWILWGFWTELTLPGPARKARVASRRNL